MCLWQHLIYEHMATSVQTLQGVCGKKNGRGKEATQIVGMWLS